jgi:hypothetical protein
MSGARHDMTPGDPIEEYLDQLRAGLRAAPHQAEVILAEAEDHLRETAAAGLAIGMTEREAQEAAISSFGQVRAVVRAHQARHGRVAAVLGDAFMVAWKLCSLLLVTFGLSGLAAVAVFTPRERVVGPCVRFIFWLRGQPTNSCTPSAPRLPGPPGGSQDIPLQFLRAFRPIVFNPDVRWLAWSATAAAGLILLAGYRLARRRQWRRGRLPGPMLAGSFPLLAAGFFGAIAVAFAMLDASGAGVKVAPGLAVAGCLALALGYAVRTCRTLLRQPRG